MLSLELLEPLVPLELLEPLVPLEWQEPLVPLEWLEQQEPMEQLEQEQFWEREMLYLQKMTRIEHQTLVETINLYHQIINMN